MFCVGLAVGTALGALAAWALVRWSVGHGFESEELTSCRYRDDEL
jgi:hypothetical protein